MSMPWPRCPAPGSICHTVWPFILYCVALMGSDRGPPKRWVRGTRSPRVGRSGDWDKDTSLSSFGSKLLLLEQSCGCRVHVWCHFMIFKGSRPYCFGPFMLQKMGTGGWTSRSLSTGRVEFGPWSRRTQHDPFNPNIERPTLNLLQSIFISVVG